MSEQAPSSGEQSREAIEAPEHKAEQSASENHEQASASADQIENIRKNIDQAATPKEKASNLGEQPKAPTPTYVNRELKSLALNRSLKQIQHKLPAAQRGLSKLVHQPLIKNVSEVSAKTVARPSGLLGGGICAFAGSLAYFYVAKHTGYSYNYLLFTAFFVVGFAVGLVIETIVFVFTRKHRSRY